jgi:hypothetical protein
MELLGDLPLKGANERLAGMVHTLAEDVQAMALRNAYAIDMLAPDTLTRRRERIATIHGISIDAIELDESLQKCLLTNFDLIADHNSICSKTAIRIWFTD